jgi:CheY-like chemotaxis protein
MLGTNPQRLCKIRRCVFGSSAPEGRADGFDLRRFQVGQVYDVGTVLANLLLAEGWAVPIDVPEPALVIPLSKLSDKVVLVVDDDRDVRTMLNHLLAFAGFAVIEAANGGDALVALVRQAGPDHPDLRMPGMDGSQFRDAQRRLQDHELASISILIVSAADNAGEMAKTLGAAGIFEKPVDPDRLLRAVQARM